MFQFSWRFALSAECRQNRSL